MFKLHKPQLSGSIHSGHFMVSRLDDDEDEDNVDPADDSSESERDNANSVEIEVDATSARCNDINNLTVDIENPNIRREHLTSWNDLDRPSKQHQYLTYLSSTGSHLSHHQHHAQHYPQHHHQQLLAAGVLSASVSAAGPSSGLLPAAHGLSPIHNHHNHHHHHHHQSSARSSPISGVAGDSNSARINNQLDQLHQHHQHSLAHLHQHHQQHQQQHPIQANHQHHYHHQHAVTIDTSLTKLLECMSLYYSSKLTSPKWKSFKGLKLRLKYKIRLNNLIWRAWFLQCIRGRRPPGCQFTAAPVETDVHKKAETIVLEGKYWKRKEKAIVDEYKKWRIFHKQKSRMNCFRPSSFDWESRVSSLNTTSSIYCPDYDMNITYDIDDLPPIIEEIDNRDCTQDNSQYQFELGNCLALDQQQQQQQQLQPHPPTVAPAPPPQPLPLPLTGPAQPAPLAHPVPFPDQFYLQQQPQQQQQQQPQPQPQHLQPQQHNNNNQQQHNFHQLHQILQPAQMQLPQHQLAQLQTPASNNSQHQQPQQQHPLSLKREYPINMISLQHQQQQPQQQQQQPQPQLQQEPIAHLPLHHHQQFSQQQHQQQQHQQNQQHLLHLQQQNHLHQQHQQYQQQQQQQQHTQLQQYQQRQPTLNLTLDNNHLYQQLQQQQQQLPAALASVSSTPGPSTTSSTPVAVQQPPSPGLDIVQQQDVQQQQQQLVIRRVCHINAEQKRRCNIKNGFDTLKSILPSINQNVNIKISKASMLQKAAVHISNLSAEQKQLMDEKLVLKQQIDNLKQTINSYQSQLPASGGSSGCQSSIQAREMLQEYVRKRTLENWKFWIFSLLIEPLFDSYYNTVSANNLEDACKTIFSWLDRSCGLFSLRKDVLESLTFLSTRTSVLNSPQTLPNEAVEAVKYQQQNQQQLQHPQQQQLQQQHQQTPF